MESPEKSYHSLVSRFTTVKGVEEGNLMRSPALTYQSKVFAFYYKDSMGFRLGPDFDPDAAGLNSIHPLSPFKTKPPLKGWYVVDQLEKDHWSSLCDQALEFTKTLQ